MPPAEKVVQNYLDESLRYGRVPRVSDLREFAKRKNLNLKLKRLKEIINLHDATMMNRPQQRQPSRSQKYRPIVVNNLGTWHCDIGFFAINKKYPTPPTYRAGFLVAKDVLSRRIYATPLFKNRKAPSMVKAFEKLLKEHAEHYPGSPNVKSISFDRETSIVGKLVQKYFAEKGIAFHAFRLSDSKAKHAENAIKQVRSVVAVLLRRNLPKDRWWNLLPTAVSALNDRPVVVSGRSLGFSPSEVNEKNLGKFKKKLFGAAPAYYWAQFPLSPKWTTWKYTVGTVVRVKLVAVSSATIGVKHSEINLTQDLFEIVALVPYVTRNMQYGRAYRCRNLDDSQHTEVFQEDEIVPGRESSI